LVLTVWCCLGPLPAARAQAEASEIPPYLLSLRQGIQHGLDNLDGLLSQAAREIGGLGIRNPKVNDVLRLVLVGQSFTISCSVISAGGFMVAVEPAEFSRLEDYNLRVATNRPQKQATTEPALTRRFPTAEGGWAVALTHPIQDQQDQFLGWLSLLLDPDDMMRTMLAQAPPSGGRRVWLVQGDGVLLHHDQAGDIGRNLLTDPAYLARPGMGALGRRLMAEAEGELKAEQSAGLLPQSGAQVNWVSLGLHGAIWRLVLVEPAG